MHQLHRPNGIVLSNGAYNIHMSVTSKCHWYNRIRFRVNLWCGFRWVETTASHSPTPRASNARRVAAVLSGKRNASCDAWHNGRHWDGDSAVKSGDLDRRVRLRRRHGFNKHSGGCGATPGDTPWKRPSPDKRVRQSARKINLNKCADNGATKRKCMGESRVDSGNGMTIKGTLYT